VLYREPFDLGEYDDNLSEVILPIATAALKVFPKVFFVYANSF